MQHADPVFVPSTTFSQHWQCTLYLLPRMIHTVSHGKEQLLLQKREEVHFVLARLDARIPPITPYTSNTVRQVGHLQVRSGSWETLMAVHNYCRLVSYSRKGI
jgi:hypothetical protein